MVTRGRRARGEEAGWAMVTAWKGNMAARQAFESTGGQEISRVEAESLGEEGHKVAPRSKALKCRMQDQKCYR